MDNTDDENHENNNGNNILNMEFESDEEDNWTY